MRASVAAEPLLNRREQVLYGRLVRAFPGHVILSHVAVSRVLIADFVVCRADFTALAVVAIGADEPLRVAQRERNRRNDLSLRAAGIKVIRLPANDLPDEAALKALVAAHPLHCSTEQLVRRAS